MSARSSQNLCLNKKIFCLITLRCNVILTSRCTNERSVTSVLFNFFSQILPIKVVRGHIGFGGSCQRQPSFFPSLNLLNQWMDFDQTCINTRLAKRWSILILTGPVVKTGFNRSLLVDWWSIEVVDWVD